MRSSSSVIFSLSTSTSSRTANMRWLLTRSMACSILLSIATVLPADVLPTRKEHSATDDMAPSPHTATTARTTRREPGRPRADPRIQSAAPVTPSRRGALGAPPHRQDADAAQAPTTNPARRGTGNVSEPTGIHRTRTPKPPQTKPER
uniref:Putative secreted protein n=1 Tax=Ixodes ricinus TaxID=34613 RepID=A0A6B0UV55_IXORI